MRICPWYVGGFHAVRCARRAWRLRVDSRLELHHVEMTPATLFSEIVNGTCRATFWACCPHCIVYNLDIQCVFVCIKQNAGYLPCVREAESLRIMATFSSHDKAASANRRRALATKILEISGYVLGGSELTVFIQESLSKIGPL